MIENIYIVLCHFGRLFKKHKDFRISQLNFKNFTACSRKAREKAQKHFFRDGLVANYTSPMSWRLFRTLWSWACWEAIEGLYAWTSNVGSGHFINITWRFRVQNEQNKKSSRGKDTIHKKYSIQERRKNNTKKTYSVGLVLILFYIQPFRVIFDHSTMDTLFYLSTYFYGCVCLFVFHNSRQLHFCFKIE